MSSSKHLGRVVDGVPLIAKEIVNHSKAIESARNGNLETLVTSSLKKALVPATALSGLTKRKVREVSSPRVKEESVVFFNEIATEWNFAAADVPLQSIAKDQDARSGEISGSGNVRAQPILEEKVEIVDQRIGALQ